VLCAATLRACRGRLWLLSVMLLYLTGVVSAFLDNVTTMLLMGWVLGVKGGAKRHLLCSHLDPCRFVLH
jgi:hypothetical protein